MSKAKKGPAKKPGKKGKTKPMRPAYMAAKKASASKSGPAPSSGIAALQAQVKKYGDSRSWTASLRNADRWMLRRPPLAARLRRNILVKCEPRHAKDAR